MHHRFRGKRKTYAVVTATSPWLAPTCSAARRSRLCVANRSMASTTDASRGSAGAAVHTILNSRPSKASEIIGVPDEGSATQGWARACAMVYRLEGSYKAGG